MPDWSRRKLRSCGIVSLVAESMSMSSRLTIRCMKPTKPQKATASSCMTA